MGDDRTGQRDTVIGSVVDWIAGAFGWWYFLVATLIIVFVLFLALSRYGKIKLGPNHSLPRYNVFTWGAIYSPRVSAST